MPIHVCLQVPEGHAHRSPALTILCTVVCTCTFVCSVVWTGACTCQHIPWCTDTLSPVRSPAAFPTHTVLNMHLNRACTHAYACTLNIHRRTSSVSHAYACLHALSMLRSITSPAHVRSCTCPRAHRSHSGASWWAAPSCEACWTRCVYMSLRVCVFLHVYVYSTCAMYMCVRTRMSA